MKTKYWILPCLACLGASLVAGCNASSESSQTAGTSAQRLKQPAQDTSLPPAARQKALQQEQQKSQMDAMRATDAAKSK